MRAKDEKSQAPATSIADAPGIHEQTTSAAFRHLHLTAVPSELLTLKNVMHIDLSGNQITRFPGALVSREMLRLEVLLLHDNLLHVLEDLLALAVLPRLRELNLLQNPLRLLHNRIYLFEALFQARGCEDELLLMISNDKNLKHCDEENVLPPQTMRFRTKLPRKHGFPMLQKLNDEWITDAEMVELENECGMIMKYYQPPTGLHHNAYFRSRKKKATAAAVTIDQRNFDGSRMTIKQMLRNEARSVAIPAVCVIQRIQVDTESGEEVKQVITSNDVKPIEDNLIADGENEDMSEHEVLQRLFRPANSVYRPQALDSSQTVQDESAAASADEPTLAASTDDVEETLEPWNFPIATFDRLTSEDRHYVRIKSKQTDMATLERDDHFFHSSVFLDCVAQCERSRRLTMRAVDLLTQRQNDEHGAAHMNGHLLAHSVGGRSMPPLPTCAAAAALEKNLTQKFTRELDQKSYEQIMAFQDKQTSVNGFHIRAAIGDHLLNEHLAQKQKVNHLLHGKISSHSSASRKEQRQQEQMFGSIEASIEDSLSKVKLRNAVDLAHTLSDVKQQKRMAQALIDVDLRMIEVERIAQEQASHRERLRLIETRQFTGDDKRQLEQEHRSKSGHKVASPWQERNWKANEQQQLRQKQQQLNHQISGAIISSEPLHPRSAQRDTHRTNQPKQQPPKPSKTATQINNIHSHHNNGHLQRKTTKFRTIETVEQAAKDPLAAVTSHDLLVRCAEIRQHADKHMKALTQYRDRFLEDEAAWEAMRQDPITVIRRHLKRQTPGCWS